MAGRTENDVTLPLYNGTRPVGGDGAALPVPTNTIVLVTPARIHGVPVDLQRVLGRGGKAKE